jgi:hypothetical protein
VQAKFKKSSYVGYTYRLISCNYLKKNSDVVNSSMWRWKHASTKWNWEHVRFKTGCAKIGSGDFCCLNKCINIMNADKTLFFRSFGIWKSKKKNMLMCSCTIKHCERKVTHQTGKPWLYGFKYYLTTSTEVILVCPKFLGQL